MFKYLVDRASERSTWLGVIAFASSVGVSVNPEIAGHVATIGVAAAGVVSALTKDKQ